MTENYNDYIEQDKSYFIDTIKKMHKNYKNTNKEIVNSKHIAKHPNGITNIAFYDVKKNLVAQYNNVSEVHKNGTSQIFYRL